jgi:hypothetical protein
MPKDFKPLGGSMFNTLKYAKMMEEVGFSREQSETSVRILVEIMEDKLASKLDVYELKKDIAELKKDVAQDLAHLEAKLTIKMGTMLAATIAILTAIQKLV